MATKTYRCKRSFAIGAGGTNRVIRAGDIIAAGDPRFRQYKHLLGDPKFFESAEEYIERTIEQATAEPGEKRNVATRPSPGRKAAKKAAKAKDPEPKPETKAKDPEPDPEPEGTDSGQAPESDATKEASQ